MLQGFAQGEIIKILFIKLFKLVQFLFEIAAQILFVTATGRPATPTG